MAISKTSDCFFVSLYPILKYALIHERFIYSVFTKDTLDEKGQARDTGTHVTFNALNSEICTYPCILTKDKYIFQNPCIFTSEIPPSETAVSLRSVVTFVKWLIARTPSKLENLLWKSTMTRMWPQFSVDCSLRLGISLQGGQDSKDPLSLQVIFCESDLCLVALLWKMICNLGDPMSHRHPVYTHTHTHSYTRLPFCHN